MDIGMLWFDNDQKAPLDAKVIRAATYYEEKYGVKPNLCFINSAIYPKGIDPNSYMEVNGTEVRASKLIGINHFWIGVKDNELAHAIHKPSVHEQR